MINFDIEKLTNSLENNLTSAAFAYLFGSSLDGKVKAGSDLDVAVYFTKELSADLVNQAVSVVEKAVPGAEVDLAILNTAGVIVCFESLQGKLLFVRNEFIENYVSFYSSVCMNYEETVWWRNRQLEYRGYDL